MRDVIKQRKLSARYALIYSELIYYGLRVMKDERCARWTNALLLYETSLNNADMLVIKAYRNSKRGRNGCSVENALYSISENKCRSLDYQIKRRFKELVSDFAIGIGDYEMPVITRDFIDLLKAERRKIL